MPEYEKILSVISWIAVIVSIILLVVSLLVLGEEGEDSSVKWRIAMPMIPILLPVISIAAMGGIYKAG